MFKKLAIFMVGAAIAAAPAMAQKRKVTVMDFGYATVRTSVTAIFGTDQDIGKGISDLLIKQLLDGGNYRIIERSALDKVMAEQNFSNSDRANPATAAKIGALLGVDAMIIGDITTFGSEDKHVGGGGGGGTWYSRGAGALNVGKNKTIVEITARVVDVNTGEILASVSGRGETQKTQLGMGGGGSNGWKGGGGALNMGSSNFQESGIGKAVKMSVTQLATNLDVKAATLPAPAAMARAPLAGMVADVSGNQLILNVGSAQGVRVGDVLAVSHAGRVITDPATGKVLTTTMTKLGTVTITSVDASSSVGTFNGSPGVKVSDRVALQ